MRRILILVAVAVALLVGSFFVYRMAFPVDPKFQPLVLSPPDR